MFTRGSLFCVSGFGVGVPVRKVGSVVSDILVVSFGFSDVELVVASVVIGIRTRSSVFCVTAIRPLISNYVNSRIMNVLIFNIGIQFTYLELVYGHCPKIRFGS